ncbi:putative oxidoreductase protein [Pseudooceanicola batsensis HTCC2597]|uniref:Putative oxidoreductase protein n=1 Tax=Pseudooceanicola batsensis (strain ATCC BAA-863 / DSM 15984 / KCTC 12145 / HTCC2597) TaxID=252305 RepID=A3TWS3_PSEBH|nr:SDR family oxidoreductase [Pseudooceanicola batsensis]EAQ03283.1 putative oxidoreductase protein [Pseudooceanicola batsensis HTCC2597]
MTYPKPPFPEQPQPLPGQTDRMDPRPDHGEESYRGSGKLEGMAALITGADSGIGRAVALAYAREGADVMISYLEEHDEADVTRALVEEAGRRAFVMPGDIQDGDHCRTLVRDTREAFGRIDILVNNAAHQMHFDNLEDITDEEWDMTFRTNIHSMFYLCKAAVPIMEKGGSIINTASINSDKPNPGLLAYAATKGAIQNFTVGLAQMLAPRGIRANCVAPGPVWTPLIPATLPPDSVAHFGENKPIGRPAQPAELATAYVMLADPLSSYTTGATVEVIGGIPMI